MIQQRRVSARRYIAFCAFLCFENVSRRLSKEQEKLNESLVCSGVVCRGPAAGLRSARRQVPAEEKQLRGDECPSCAPNPRGTAAAGLSKDTDVIYVTQCCHTVQLHGTYSVTSCYRTASVVFGEKAKAIISIC